MSSLLSNGTAPIIDAVLEQLSAKHPERNRKVCWPHPKKANTKMDIDIDRRKTPRPMDIDKEEERRKTPRPMETYKEGERDSPMHPANTQTEEPRETEPGIGYPSITATKGDILQAASSAKRYTSGGLQQITPWHIKRALFATSDNDCATKASLLATRWGRGGFTTSLAELVAEAKLIALFKDKKRSM